jgi:mono/diheme cytochrome c family protein
MEKTMSSSRKARRLAIGLIFAACSTATAQEMKPGQLEFQVRCAACHGMEGLGDGPVGQLLKMPPPNLALISQRNGGSFPFERVFEIIDGRKEMAAHGTRDMPIWGDFYRAEPMWVDPETGEATEGMMAAEERAAEAEILALTYFIGTLQTTQK